jgi:hypothetical protein
MKVLILLSNIQVQSASKQQLAILIWQSIVLLIDNFALHIRNGALFSRYDAWLAPSFVDPLRNAFFLHLSPHISLLGKQPSEASRFFWINLHLALKFFLNKQITQILVMEKTALWKIRVDRCLYFKCCLFGHG